MNLDNIFFEEPKAKHKFLEWFEARNPRGYDPNKMPEFMTLAIVVKWFDVIGIYIDRDIESRCFRIWDYREEEPTDATIVDATYLTYDCEDWREAIRVALCIYLNKSIE